MTNISNTSNVSVAYEDNWMPPFPSRGLQLPVHYFVLLLTICVPTCLFDIAILLIIAKHRLLWSVQTAYLSSLACSDLCYVTGGVVYGSLGVAGLGSQAWDDHLGRLIDYFFWFSTSATYLSFLVVSLNRWLYIARPFLYQRLVNKTSVGVSIAVIWILATVCNSSYFLFDRRYVNSVYILPVVHSASCIFIIIIYAHIIIIARRQARAVSQALPVSDLAIGGHQPVASSKPKHWRAVKMLLGVFSVFALTLSPYVYTNAVQNVTDSSDLRTVVAWLILLNTLHYSVNFNVYVVHNPALRTVLRSCVKSLVCCKKISSVSQSSREEDQRPSCPSET